MTALDNPRIKTTGLPMVRGPVVTRSALVRATGPVAHSSALRATRAISWFSGRLAPPGPTVDRIGLRRTLFILGDLFFLLLYPRRYRQIRTALGDRAPDRRRLGRLAALIDARLTHQGIPAQIHGRCKHIASIDRKMVLKGVTLDQIHDLRALRIIVPDVRACYETLANLERLFPILPDRADDYIARPKPNGYQSPHTTILDPERNRCEVQIRTPSMHRTAKWARPPIGATRSATCRPSCAAPGWTNGRTQPA